MQSKTNLPCPAGRIPIQQTRCSSSRTPCCAILVDRVDAVGDRLWRMDRRLTHPPVDQAGTRGGSWQKRRQSRRPSGKKS